MQAKQVLILKRIPHGDANPRLELAKLPQRNGAKQGPEALAGDRNRE